MVDLIHLVMAVILLKSFEAIDCVLLKFCLKGFLLWNRWIWMKYCSNVCDHFSLSYKSGIYYLYPPWLLEENVSLRLLILVWTTAGESNLHLNEQFTTMSFRSWDALDRFSMHICSSSYSKYMQSTAQSKSFIC